MNYICPICLLDPSSHSLIMYKEVKNVIYLYTCPSESKLYFDTKGIIIHYDGVLSQIPESKKWIWVIDSKDFAFKHFIEFNVGLELANLISSKFSKNLLKIIIINSTNYITYTYNFLKPFLSDVLKNIIEFNTDCNHIEKLILNN